MMAKTFAASSSAGGAAARAAAWTKLILGV